MATNPLSKGKVGVQRLNMWSKPKLEVVLAPFWS